MKLITRTFIILLIAININEIHCESTGSINLHGYIQTRFTTDFDQSNDFMIRRGKLWVDGIAPGLDNVTYKMQFIYRSFKDEAFMFQDAFADVHFDNFGCFRAGRFIPDFMLQRMQPDYEIPYIERAIVINSLVHSTKSMARQIGVQYTYQTKQSPLHFSLGAFNANLESPGKNKDVNLLYTTHLQYNLYKNDYTLIEVGGSGSYRYANGITMSNIFNSNQIIVGNDYRWGFETQLNYKDFGFQSEYVQANINKEKAWGYYANVDFYFTKSIQGTVEMEKYNDLIPTTNDNEWYGLGLNYYFTEKTKLMADFKTQFSSIKNNYLGELQFQVFFK
ncbi:MAG: porin [Candidatus Kapaibacteriota bacterium]